MVQFPGFTIHWPTFGFPSHMLFFRAVTIAVYHSGRYKPQSRTIMWSRESLPSTVNLFGGQSGSHFTMLTPRENLDVDSEDLEPAPHRHSGFRVVAEGGLQLSQFLTRISNKRSSEIRVYSFQSRKPLPMTTKMGDLPLKMSIQIWSEDLAKAIEDGLKSCHVRSADKDDAKDYKVFFIRHISSWEFFDSCETDRAQQDRRIQQLSDAVNSLRTRLENLERAQGTR